MPSLIKRYPIITFFLLAYAITWGILFPLILNFEEIARDALLYELWHALGALGPAAAALIVVRFLSEESKRQFRNNFQTKELLKPVNLFLITTPITLFGLALGFNYAATGTGFDLDSFLQSKELYTFTDAVIYLTPMVAYGIFEEIGWRGFALPGLQRRFNALIATLILAVLWAFWHFPMFYYRFDYDMGLTFGFVLGLSFGAVLLTCIYNSTRGSVIAVIIWHVLWNLVSPLDPEGLSVYISMGIVVLVILLVILWGVETLNYREEKETKHFY